MQRRDITGSNYSLADWEDELRRFAPGYLELEAQGQAIEFDLANLWTDGYEGYAHLPEEWKMRMRILGHH